MSRASRLFLLGALGALLALALVGCGSGEPAADDEPTATASSAGESPSSSPSSSPSRSSASPSRTARPAGPVLVVRVDGDRVTADERRLRVERGQVVTILITADRAGELHVHSSPEQEVAFDEGSTTRRLRFSVPGLVEVEEHESGSELTTLEVR